MADPDPAPGQIGAVTLAQQILERPGLGMDLGVDREPRRHGEAFRRVEPGGGTPIASARVAMSTRDFPLEQIPKVIAFMI